MKKSILLLASIAVLASSLPVATKAATQVYDLNADWSDTLNPNGTWSYRWNDGSLLNNDPFPWSAFGGNSGLSAITKTTEAAVVPGYLELGDISVLPGDGVRVRWTAPKSGTIDTSGAIWNADTDVEWTLRHNGSDLSSGSSFTSSFGPTRSSPYDLLSGSGGSAGLLNIPVEGGDQVELLFSSYLAIGVNFTITLTANSSGCPNASFAEDAIIWHQPLARNGASEDTDPSVGRTVKYRFKRGSTIPIQIHALGCTADVTSNANVIGKVTVFGDSNCDGATDDTAAPIDFNGVGGGGGVMDKIGGHLKYNLDTKSLPTTTQCYILRVTVTDTSTGEEKFEEVLLQGK